MPVARTTTNSCAPACVYTNDAVPSCTRRPRRSTGVWATIGSTNLDWRSFLHNDELNAVVLGTDFARQMDAMFERDRATATPIDPEQWQRRSLFLRLQEWIARRFEYWL